MTTRRLRGARAIVAALVAGMTLASASPAVAQEPKAHVIVLWIDGTQLADWSAPGLPNFGKLLDQGAVGLLATRARGGAAGTPLARARAAEDVGATVCSGRYPESLGSIAHRSGSTLARALAGAGLRAEIVAGTADDGETERLARIFGCTERSPAPVSITFAMRKDSRFPTGRRADVVALRDAARTAIGRSDLVIVDFGDGARVEREFGLDDATRQPWMNLAMRRADALLGQLRALAGEQDTLLVVSPTPPRSRVADGVHLGAMAIAGMPGVLRSDTSHRDGVVAIADLGPTLLSLAGVAIPAEMTGRPISVRARTGGIAAVQDLERELVAGARARRPLTRTFLAIAMALALLGLLTIASGRGRPPQRRRIPRGWRDVLAVGLIATAALPAAVAIPIPTAIGDPRTAASVAVLIPLAAALVFAVLARATVGRERALLAAASLSFALPLLDPAVPGSLGAGLGFPIASGARGGGADASMAGVILGAGLVAAGAMLDRARALRRTKGIILGMIAVTVVLLGSERFGARPAMAVLAAAAGGALFALPSRRRGAFLGAGTAAAITAGLLALERASDGGRLATAGGIVRTLLGIFGSTVDIGAFTIWPVALAVCTAPGVILWRRRRTLLDRGMWGRPYTRAALVTAAAAAALLVLIARGGLVGATWIAVFVSAGLLLPLLAPDDVLQGKGESGSHRRRTQ